MKLLVELNSLSAEMLMDATKIFDYISIWNTWASTFKTAFLVMD